MSSPRRPPRDPNAPKRNMSAYLLYQNAMRETFKMQNPGMTFGQLSKYTSSMYAEMPPDEKEAWNKRAEQDKKRYLDALSNYVPGPGYDAKGDARADHPAHAAPTKRKGSSTKTPRDPNAPKRNMSAYLLYQNCYREQFKSLNPGITFGQLAKYTSYMYKVLPIEEKQRWEAHAAQDKARYEAEMTAYTPPPGYDTNGNLVEDRRLNKKYIKRIKDPEQPKRARGSFVFFSFEERPKVAKEFPGIKFVDMGVILGQRWRALPAADKAPFEEKAAEDKQRFNKEMEEYTAKRIAAEPQHPMATVADYGHQEAPAAASNQAQYGDQQHYAEQQAAAAAAHHAYYADPNAAAYYADPNAHHPDPYGQHAYYHQAGQQQYHYA